MGHSWPSSGSLLRRYLLISRFRCATYIGRTTFHVKSRRSPRHLTSNYARFFVDASRRAFFISSVVNVISHSGSIAEIRRCRTFVVAAMFTLGATSSEHGDRSFSPGITSIRATVNAFTVNANVPCPFPKRFDVPTLVWNNRRPESGRKILWRP